MGNLEVKSKASAALEMGDLLVAYLNQLGVEYVFGVPGGAIEPLYNALARSERQGGVRAVVARHETGAAFMADGYARNTGKLGVCCSTTGPGATNMITGVASAYENNVPMLAITAQTSILTFGKGAIQDSSCTGINTVGLYQHCTRYNTLISHPAQFEHKLSASIMSAMGSPAGPAHISVPRDVMALAAEGYSANYQLHNLLDKPALLDSDAVEQLFEELSVAKKVVFIIGDEACDAIGSILSLAVAIDDFGSGYSSLNYLKRLPVDVLKIDRSFIQDIETDPNDSGIVASIITMAQTLNMTTVAEGVETEGQRKILNKLGCDSFQGYLIAKPQPADQFEQQFLLNSKTSVPDTQ